MLRLAHRAKQTINAKVMQRINVELAGYFCQIMLSRNKLATRRKINSIKTRELDRRAGNADVHLFCAKFTQLFYACHHGSTAHDTVVNDTNELAFNRVPHRVDLNPHAKTAHALLRLNKGTPNIVVAYHGVLIGQARALRKAKSRVNTRVRKRHDVVNFGCGFVSQIPTHFFAA